MTSAAASRLHRTLARAGWAAAGALFLAAVILRFVDLAQKPFAHDESLFAYYSYCVYPLGNYRYDPLLHGPLLEHLTGALFALAGPDGDSDFTARFWPALLGSLCVFLIWGFRRRIGQSGALAACAMACFSPTLLYYSRFLRNDIPLLFFTLLLLLSFDRWIGRRKAAWAAFFLVVNAGLMVCVKENSAFVFFTGATYLAFALGVDLAAGAWRRWRSSGSPAEALGLRRRRGWGQLADGAELLRSIQIGIANGLAWAALILVARQLVPGLFPPPALLALILALFVALSYLAVSVLVRARRRALGRDRLAGLFVKRVAETWLALGSGLLISLALYAALFTTLFRFHWGFFQIYRETVAYWWGQHMEHRLKGPFHYYAPRLLVYETAPLALALGGAAALLLRRWRLLAVALAGELAIVALLRLALAIAPFDEAWADRRLHMTAPRQLYMAFTVAWLAVCLTGRAILARQGFHGWLVWWTGFSFIEYSYAGEKVPWLGVHIAAPLILLAGSEVGRLGRWVAEGGGWRWLRAPAAGLAVAAWALLLLRGAWVACEVSFERGADPGEALVYNHTLPETVEVAREIEALARDCGAGYDLEMTVDSEASWPLIWYLRRYSRFSLPDPLESTTDPIIIVDEDKRAKVTRTFEEYVVRKVGLRQAWTPEELELRAMWLSGLGRLGVRPRLDDGETSAGRQLTIEKGREEWVKGWRYFWKQEPWLRPGETAISVPVTFLYMRRSDTLGREPGGVEFKPAAPGAAASEPVELIVPEETPGPGLAPILPPETGAQPLAILWPSRPRLGRR